MFNVAVVGLGNIGALYDINSQDRTASRSHVGAIINHPRFNLAAIIEPNKERRLQAKNFWQFDSSPVEANQLSELPQELVEILVIATPTSTHLTLIRDAIEKRPRVIILEKPLANSIAEAQEIYNLCRANQITCYVNYQRRYLPSYQAILDEFLYTPPSFVCGRYNKGLMNYASHLVDLLYYWFGEMHASPIDEGKVKQNPSFTLHFKTGLSAMVLGIDGLQYEQFEIDLFYENAKVSISNGGIIKQKHSPKESLQYKNYFFLEPDKTYEEDNLKHVLWHLYESLSHCEGYSASLCTVEQALYTNQVLEQVTANRLEIQQ